MIASCNWKIITGGSELRPIKLLTFIIYISPSTAESYQCYHLNNIYVFYVDTVLSAFFLKRKVFLQVYKSVLWIMAPPSAVNNQESSTTGSESKMVLDYNNINTRSNNGTNGKYFQLIIPSLNNHL